MRLLALIISIGIAVLPKLAQAQTDCGMPSVGEDHWQVAAPESVGLTSATLCPMVKWLDDWKQSNIHAVLVVRHGTLVFEHYFSGADEHWGRSVGEVAFGPEIKHDERSVTKSIVALVLGIAIDRGLIKSLGEPVLSFFPDYADLRTPEKDRITLRDLVTMSGGLERKSHGQRRRPLPLRAAAVGRRAVGAALELQFGIDRGDRRGAEEGDRQVGRRIGRHAAVRAAGITDVEWPRNARGDPIAAGALRLRPRDLAKIGQLVLQHGAWNGTQVVPASWIEAATSPQINVSGFTSFFYGYFFWLGRSLADKREVQWAAAVGLGGQRVFIVPSLDLVVVVNAGLYSSRLQSSVPMTILNQYVLRATAFRP